MSSRGRELPGSVRHEVALAMRRGRGEGPGLPSREATAAGAGGGMLMVPNTAPAAAADAGEGPGARVHPTSDQSITSGSETAVVWHAADWDLGGLFGSSGDGYLTLPLAGIYLVEACIVWEYVEDSTHLTATYLMHGSTRVGQCDTYSRQGAQGQPVAMLVNAAANDQVSVKVLQETGSALHIVASQSHLGAQRLRAV